jgi:hypothetical protein
MPRLSKNVPPNKDREYFPVKDRGKTCQPAFVRSKHIQNFEDLNAVLRRIFFLKNEVAMPLGGDWNINISLSFDGILISKNPNKTTK